METGFSTWTWPGHTEEDQENYVNIAPPVIREKVKANNKINENKIGIACWYELKDSTGTWLDIEGNFGILEKDWSKKIAYDDLQHKINIFSRR